jgi:hypothetical protein
MAATARLNIANGRSNRDSSAIAATIATMYAMMEDRDHTFEWLEKAYAERSGRMEYIKMEDFFKPFHFDPRYLDLLRREGMPRS